MQMTTDPPAIGDLIWEADRVSLYQLDADTRRLLERVGEEIAEAWPIDDVEPDACSLDDHEEWPSLLAKIEGLGVPLGETPVDEDELVAKIKAALEHERAEGEKDATIPSRANTAQRKAMRLLLEGRVDVKVVDRHEDGTLIFAHAKIKGDSDVYDCGYDGRPQRPWRCTCPELRGDCSHLAALKMIVARAS